MLAVFGLIEVEVGGEHKHIYTYTKDKQGHNMNDQRKLALCLALLEQRDQCNLNLRANLDSLTQNDKDLFNSHNKDFDREVYTRCVKALDQAAEFKQIYRRQVAAGIDGATSNALQYAASDAIDRFLKLRKYLMPDQEIYFRKSNSEKLYVIG